MTDEIYLFSNMKMSCYKAVEFSFIKKNAKYEVQTVV